MSSYLSVPIAGILWFTTGEHSHHQKRWQLFSSLEDELAQGLGFGPMPGCTTAAHRSGELQTQTGSRSTGKDLSPPNWKYLQKRVIHTINISVTFWLTSECPECRKLAAKSPSCCHICGELMPRGTSTMHSLRVYFWRGQPTTAACFGSWFESSQIFAGELLYPHLRGWALQLLRILGSPHGMGSWWDWEAPALSHPTLVADSSRVRKKSLTWVSFCVQN